MRFSRYRFLIDVTMNYAISPMARRRNDEDAFCFSFNFANDITPMRFSKNYLLCLIILGLSYLSLSTSFSAITFRMA